MTTPDPEAIQDFTLPAQPKRFRIDGDVFQGPAIISGIALGRLSKLHAELGDLGDLGSNIERALGAISRMFKILLPGPSGERFAERLQSETEPIDLQRQALPALYWLLEQYGMRPTQPSSPSPTGSTDGATDTQNGGTSSTDGPSPTE